MLPYHPVIQANGVEQNKRRLSALAEPVLCQPLKIMLLRAVTLFKDLISNNACKLLSGNLTPSVWTQRQEKPSLFPPPLGAAAGGRDEGNCVKRDAEPQTWFWNVCCMVPGNHDFPGWWVSRRQKWKCSFFFPLKFRTVQNRISKSWHELPNFRSASLTVFTRNNIIRTHSIYVCV